MGSRANSIQPSLVGHQNSERLSLHKMGQQINKKMRENILSGRFYAETPAERRMLEEHLANQK